MYYCGCFQRKYFHISLFFCHPKLGVRNSKTNISFFEKLKGRFFFLQLIVDRSIWIINNFRDHIDLTMTRTEFGILRCVLKSEFALKLVVRDKLTIKQKFNHKTKVRQLHEMGIVKMCFQYSGRELILEKYKNPLLPIFEHNVHFWQQCAKYSVENITI